MKNIFGLVGDFAYNILRIQQKPYITFLSEQRKKALVKHLQEELTELQQTSILQVENDADALIDIMYICARGLYEMGFSSAGAQFAFEEVHRANMEKVSGHNTRRPEAGEYDAIKPKNWQGPNWAMIIEHDKSLRLNSKPSADLNQQAKTQTAEQLVMSREELYGSFKERAKVVDLMTTAVEGHINWNTKLQSNHRHALRMIIEKIGRIIVGGDPSYADNWKDIQGYAKLAEKDQ